MRACADHLSYLEWSILPKVLITLISNGFYAHYNDFYDHYSDKNPCYERMA